MADRNHLHDQVAIVTGAARGIGAACAHALARNGARVMIVDLLPGDDAVSRIKADFPGSDIMSCQLDIRNRAQVKEVIELTASRWGRIDILVNNAGTCGRIGLEEMTDEAWDRDLDTNLRGTFLFTQLAIYPHMKNQRYGRVINVSSISGMNGGVGSVSEEGEAYSGRSGPAYAASKGGVIAFTKWVAKEVGQYGVCCNSVAPGAVSSEMTHNASYPIDQQPIKRMGTAEDIAEAVLYLASPSSSFVTGQVIKVCGGLAIG